MRGRGSRPGPATSLTDQSPAGCSKRRPALGQQGVGPQTPASERLGRPPSGAVELRASVVRPIRAKACAQRQSRRDSGVAARAMTRHQAADDDDPDQTAIRLDADREFVPVHLLMMPVMTANKLVRLGKGDGAQRELHSPPPTRTFVGVGGGAALVQTANTCVKNVPSGRHVLSLFVAFWRHPSRHSPSGSALETVPRTVSPLRGRSPLSRSQICLVGIGGACRRHPSRHSRSGSALETVPRTVSPLRGRLPLLRSRGWLVRTGGAYRRHPSRHSRSGSALETVPRTVSPLRGRLPLLRSRGWLAGTGGAYRRHPSRHSRSGSALETVPRTVSPLRGRLDGAAAEDLNSGPLPYQGSALPLSYGSSAIGAGNCHVPQRCARVAVGGSGLSALTGAGICYLPLRHRIRIAMAPSPTKPPGPFRPADDRKAREAAALRANLARRKAQARGADRCGGLRWGWSSRRRWRRGAGRPMTG